MKPPRNRSLEQQKENLPNETVFTITVFFRLNLLLHKKQTLASAIDFMTFNGK